MARRRIYKKPPIQEAICEIRYPDSQELDLRTLPEFLARLPADYSGAVTPTFEVQQIAGTPARSGAVSLNIAGPRFQIWAPDRLRLVALTRAGVAAHALAPYCGWENFRPHLLAAHRAFQETYSPKGVIRLGVRYVNRIVIPLTDFESSDYFVGIPSVSSHAGQPTLREIFSRLEGQFAATHDRFSITFGSSPSEPESSAFLLDIDVNCSYQPTAANMDVVQEQIDRLREEERDLFESSITDKTRALFDA